MNLSIYIRICVVLFVWNSAIHICAQSIHKVKVEYTYYGSENETLEQAKHTALERAKIKALEEKFGSVVSQTSSTMMHTINGSTQTGFLSSGASEVRGEWIETIGEPEYAPPYYEQDILVVKVTVSGIVREMRAEHLDIRPRILRNGIADKFEADMFRSGDDMFMSFTTPVKGFLTVYLVDGDGNAFCLLPYRRQTTGIYAVEANHRYLFFNRKEAPENEKSFVDEYVMTCERSLEQNMIYIVFSPNPFTKASDNGEDETLPRELPFSQFQKWLAMCRRHDVNMNVRLLPIRLTKN